MLIFYSDSVFKKNLAEKSVLGEFKKTTKSWQVTRDVTLYYDKVVHSLHDVQMNCCGENREKDFAF